jgi:hypothetical protein
MLGQTSPLGIASHGVGSEDVIDAHPRHGMPLNSPSRRVRLFCPFVFASSVASSVLSWSLTLPIKERHCNNNSSSRPNAWRFSTYLRRRIPAICLRLNGIKASCVCPSKSPLIAVRCPVKHSKILLLFMTSSAPRCKLICKNLGSFLTLIGHLEIASHYPRGNAPGLGLRSRTRTNASLRPLSALAGSDSTALAQSDLTVTNIGLRSDCSKLPDASRRRERRFRRCPCTCAAHGRMPLDASA